jgi:hypothetical protein
VKAVTIRNVDAALARALAREKKKRGASLNETVLVLLRQSLGVGGSGTLPSNGLKALAGGWSADDLREFERATGVFAQVDDELWS